MAGFYIKKVIAKSATKGDASVSFGNGLTIIQGRSDSGKTCVANCIDFIFGGSVDKPFKETAKYTVYGAGHLYLILSHIPMKSDFAITVI